MILLSGNWICSDSSAISQLGKEVALGQSGINQTILTTTKRNAVKNGVEIWVNWETETKKLYEQMYKELINIDEVASACKIKELICDVDSELKMAQKHHINKMSTDYNIVDIVEEQDCLHEKYKKKIEKVGVKVC